MASRLETALSLARVSSGHVSVVVDTPVARFMAMDAMGGSYLAADAIREALERDDSYAEELAAHLRREDVPFDVLRCEDEPADALVEAARLSDVIVLSRGCEFAGQVAVTARAPVLLVPDNQPLSLPVDRACVGWDGGEEAAAALRVAVPLLRHCGEVHVLSVREKEGGFPATEALRYLSRHGVKAELHELDRVGSTEEALAAGVARLQGQLLVMGAFGHSRLREFLFGGVTRYFLGNGAGPALFLAH
jgi:nucleotide-binding universal stress UspA family protein